MVQSTHWQDIIYCPPFYKAFCCAVAFALLRYGLLALFVWPGSIDIRTTAGLVAGSLFFFGFMLNGVMQDYKESEKIPQAMANSIHEYHEIISMLPIAVSSTVVRERAALAGPELLLRVLQALKAKPRCENLSPKLHYELHKAILHANRGPVESRLLDRFYLVREGLSRVEVISTTSFLPVGNLFLHLVILVNIVVFLCVKPENQVTEFTLLPGVVFILVFVLTVIADVDDPWTERGSRVSLTPLERLRAQYVSLLG